MRNLEHIVKLLQDRQPSVVARACGLHSHTVWRIKTGLAVDPSLSTIEKLNTYFDDQQKLIDILTAR